jgi:cytochrome o ubiquinol oxidase subunit 2
MTLLCSACTLARAPVLDTKGPIALAERNLLFAAFGVMLIVVVPVLVMAFLFAWRYRASNTKARYAPDWSYSRGVEALIWADAGGHHRGARRVEKRGWLREQAEVTAFANVRM